MKHSLKMTAAWARDYGIRGYDHLDPETARNEPRKKRSNDSFQKKRFNNTVSNQDRKR